MFIYMSSVILFAQNQDLYTNNNLEPQYVTAIQPNRAVVYLDVQQAKQILYEPIIDIEVPQLSNLSRISLNSFNINYITPNINRRNNVISFYSSVGVGVFTVTLREGFYTTPLAVITEIVTQLNTVSGASGLVFNSTPVYNNPGLYNLNSVGGDYFFKLDCIAITRGYQLYALPTDIAFTNTKVVGNISLLYTRYIDVCSDTLVQYSKIRTQTNGKSANLLMRIFIDDATKPHVIGFYINSGIPDISYNFLYQSQINRINFRLLDQFGDLIYLPTNNGTNGFFWDCNIFIE